DSESAFQRSAVVEFEYLCAAIYRRMPSRKTSTPRKLSSIRRNDWPFLSDIIESAVGFRLRRNGLLNWMRKPTRSEEHTSELQSLRHLVCRLLLEKKKKNKYTIN